MNDAAREAARQDDGKFGTQPLTEAEVYLINNQTKGQRERVAINVQMAHFDDEIKKLRDQQLILAKARLASRLREEFPELGSVGLTYDYSDGREYGAWIGLSAIRDRQGNRLETTPDKDGNQVDDDAVHEEINASGFGEAVHEEINASGFGEAAGKWDPETYDDTIDLDDCINAAERVIQADLDRQRDELLVVHYSPQAIREHFDAREQNALIEGLTDEQLATIGDCALSDDATWDMFADRVEQALTDFQRENG